MCKRNMDLYLVKCLAILLNTLIFFTAIVALYHAFYVYRAYETFEEMIQEKSVKRFPFVCVANFGIAACLVIFGYIAICANGFGMLICYCILMIFHAVICCVCGFYIYMHSTEAERSSFFAHVLNHNVNFTREDMLMKSLFAMQREIQCCGLEIGYSWYSFNRIPIDPSCCKDSSGDECHVEDMWMNSCSNQMQKFGTKALRWFFVLNFALSAFLFTNAGVAYLLGMAVKQFFYY